MESWLLIVISISSIFNQFSWAVSKNVNNYYIAGVVEFRPAVSGGNSSQLLNENLLAYRQIIAEANRTTDIIIFPEATLNTQLQLTAVPEVNVEQSLCGNNDDNDEIAPFLRELACAALESHTYLVINVKERVSCSNDDQLCPSRGYLMYNTNVVFNRQGAIVSRYRKWNLYLEPSTNRTSKPEYAIFKTDFGVTFGHFICFDMLFYEPAQELVERLGIHDIIVTKMFNSELPFLTASQFQQGWAWGNNVNLLASGASLPTSGISGSGIYTGQQGALVRLMVGNQTDGQRKLLVARVPIWSANGTGDHLEIAEEPAQRDLLLLQQPQMENFTSYLLPLNGSGNVSQRLCQSDLCCDFELTMSVVNGLRAPEYNYRLGVLVGQRRYEEAQYSVIRICGMFACRNASIESCGMLSENADLEPIEFNSLRIRGEFVQRERRLLMPNSLTHSLYALQPTEMTWYREENNNGSTWTEIKLTRTQKHLLAFGIYGNYFDEYNQQDGKGSVKLIGFSLWLMVLILWLMS